MKKTLENLTKAIDKAARIALIMHISPDGDTCGSALALCRGFVLYGKDARVFCDDPVPGVYGGLEGAGQVSPPEEAHGAFDLAIAVDVADRERLGRCVSLWDAAKETAQLDHHGTNPGYAGINCVRSPLSATGVLAAELLDALGVEMEPRTAECLYVAIATDTGSFKQQNTDAEALELAARCVRTGFDVGAAARRVFEIRPLAQGKLIGCALCGMEVFAGGRAALMSLSRADFVACGALPEHTEGIVNFAINTEGVEVACLLSELGDAVKCSLRALPPHDVAKIAASLCGGGHALAAGCTLSEPLPAAREIMRARLLEAFGA